MPYELTEDDRAAFREVFAPPFLWSRMVGDEALRGWKVLREDAGRILLQHGTGAVAELRRQGDRVVDVQLREGSDAEPLLRSYGFQPTDEEKARVRRALTAGRPVDRALDEAFPRRLGVRELSSEPIGGGSRRRWRVGSGGVIEVDLDTAGQVRSHRWLTGGQALDRINEALEAARWDVPEFPRNPVKVRSAAEAELYVAVQKGDPELRRDRNGRLEVVARLPEGRFRFVFERTPSASVPPSLDPADLLLFATRVESDLPAAPKETTPARRVRHAELLRLAAAGLRDAVRFVPPGEDLPPLGIYHTRAGEFLRMTQPDRFRRDAMLAQAERLDALAARWSG